jgi:hypothetical protein
LPRTLPSWLQRTWPACAPSIVLPEVSIAHSPGRNHKNVVGSVSVRLPCTTDAASCQQRPAFVGGGAAAVRDPFAVMGW